MRACVCVCHVYIYILYVDHIGHFSVYTYICIIYTNNSATVRSTVSGRSLAETGCLLKP